MDDELVIRKSQAVSPFGVGGIFEVLGQSFVACDTTFWQQSGTRIDLARLARALKVDYFKLPPTNSDFTQASLKEYMPFVRFPLWHLCASCRRIMKIKKSESSGIPVCRFCVERPKLAPIRYVKICKLGHMSDVNWHFWVHHSASALPEQQQCQNYDALTWRASRVGQNLKQGEYVECLSCRAKNYLLELVKQKTSCEGSQPWLAAESKCDEKAIARPRGATNIHFPFVESALDIPETRNQVEIKSEESSIVKSHRSYSQLLTMTPTSSIYRTKIIQVSNETGVSRQNVERIIAGDASKKSSDQLALLVVERLEVGEWAALHDDAFLAHSNGAFQARSVDISDLASGKPELLQITSLISRVVIVDKVREVRALTGFTRFNPDREFLVSPSLSVRSDWLPAIEVYGEGIFFALEQNWLREWEQQENVKQRVEEFRRLSVQSFWGQLLPQPTARMILLHTLSHLMIRQLSFNCGYSSSALRERIYSSIESDLQDMSGVLIYTSSGDSEGSLGGLAREGEPDRLMRTLISSLRGADWCSSDPICGELWSGPGALNHAACHACSLLPETSCQHRNLLLDRSLVLSSEGTGFFDSVQDVLFSDLRSN